MKASWAVEKHVAQTIRVILCAQFGEARAWRPIRLLWLSGALSDRVVPDDHWRPVIMRWRDSVLPESDHARN